MLNKRQPAKICNRFRNVLTIALALFTLCVPSKVFATAPISEKTIAGTWACTSLTALENGKQSGTVKFNPGNIAFTYREDGSWQMETNLTKNHEKARLNGNFILHKNELVLKYPDGRTYKDFHIELKDDGKMLVMTDDGSIVSASKIDPSPSNSN